MGVNLIVHSASMVAGFCFSGVSGFRHVEEFFSGSSEFLKLGAWT